MSFGLSNTKDLDPTGVGIDAAAIPQLPDDVLRRPESGQISVSAWFTDPSPPLEVEIGSGKGTFLVQQAPTQPGTNFLGIEYAHDFYLYAADRVRRLGIPNVRMLCTDAGEFVHWRVPDRSVSVVHLYFPDPWPKTRHHRRRMVSDRFLGDCLRILIPRGELRIVTDHPGYWAWMEEHFARWCAPAGPFTRAPFISPPTAREGEVVGTNFERKYRVEGRDFHAATLIAPV
ncbi:MAG: tRNA (guanosine(46)-N7)-methyltransferase TrmB [Phycisphaerales bacterium]|nr:tRNA (guanosine(46)-N7)-methyltransferase TrmB [Phycisphaerales bacterium]